MKTIDLQQLFHDAGIMANEPDLENLKTAILEAFPPARLFKLAAQSRTLRPQKSEKKRRTKRGEEAQAENPTGVIL